MYPCCHWNSTLSHCPLQFFSFSCMIFWATWEEVTFLSEFLTFITCIIHLSSLCCSHFFIYTHLSYQLWCQLCSETRLVTRRKRGDHLGRGERQWLLLLHAASWLLLWRLYLDPLDSALCFSPLAWWLPGFGFGFYCPESPQSLDPEATEVATRQELNHCRAILPGGVIVPLFWWAGLCNG